MQLNFPLKAAVRLFGRSEPAKTEPIVAPSPLKRMIDNPENFRLEAYFENDELVVRVKPKRQAAYRLEPAKTRKKQSV